MSRARTALPIQTPPSYCACAGGKCDQQFDEHTPTRGVFLYPSEPTFIAQAIEGAVAVLRHGDSKHVWRTWREFAPQGQLVFCEICRRIRFTDVVFADVTSLNFNVLFEIGVAVGLDVPVVPLRDASYERDKSSFEALGLIDTIGYVDFRNSAELARKVTEYGGKRSPGPTVSLNSRQPLYVVKGPLETEGELRLMALLKRSSLRFRAFDSKETPRLSLHEARRQISASHGLVAHLIDPNRTGARVHNARCALLAGIATAQGKGVLLFQEGTATQPIDYRDLVVEYGDPAKLEQYLEPFVRRVVGLLQDDEGTTVARPSTSLEKINLGDVAAENEIVALKSYFVRTAQYHEAKRGVARLVTGRKGAGKTAMFYAVRHSIPESHAHLVLDLKPEGYQFSKLRELVLDELKLGLQEHTMVAFWEYLVLCEIAQKIVDRDFSWAQYDPTRRERYRAVKAANARHSRTESGDFSERLLWQIDSLVDRFAARGEDDVESHAFTNELYRSEIRELEAVLAPYLKEKQSVWLLVDNLDKGWPTRGAAPADILIIRALLDSTRKLQRQFSQRGLDLNVLVFLRNDIYDLLVRSTSDRGKDTQISLDWSDPEVFREVVRQRLVSATGEPASFNDAWRRVFDPNVGLRDSFSYVLERTLMRPRDLLSFLHRALETSINRGHDRVSEEDLKAAERAYSEDMLLATTFELKDIYTDYGSLLYAFSRKPSKLSAEDLREIVGREVGVERADGVVEMLLWFCFLGVLEQGAIEPQFAYQVRYNVEKLVLASKRAGSGFAIHPAYHRALEVADLG